MLVAGLLLPYLAAGAGRIRHEAKGHKQGSHREGAEEWTGTSE
jgi:hypothetical protein